MAPSTKYNFESAKAMLQTLAAANGGHLNSKEYERLAPSGAPAFKTMYGIFNVGSWAEICEVAGIYASFGDMLPEVLDEALIREVIKRNYKGATMYSESHRQQVALWCLRQAQTALGESFTKSQYEASSKRLGLLGSWMIAAAFNDSWNRALMAAGMPVHMATKLGDERKPRKSVAVTDAHQQSVVDDMIEQLGDWRTQEHGIPILNVTEVTQVYRHVTNAEYGMRCSETRMVIR